MEFAAGLRSVRIVGGVDVLALGFLPGPGHLAIAIQAAPWKDELIRRAWFLAAPQAFKSASQQFAHALIAAFSGATTK